MIVNRCIVCSNPIPKEKFLCPTCSDLLEKDRFDSFSKRCPKCHYPLVSEDYSCQHCRDFPDFEVTSINDYSAPFSRRILQNYKFLNEKTLAEFLASEFNSALEKYDKNKTLIVPVPSSPESIKKRGWDQMQQIAKVLEKKYKYQTSPLLKTSDKAISEQKNLGKADRIQSVKSKYTVNKTLCLNMDKSIKIVLIDDIHTTGSTLFACRNILIENGFQDVSALTWLAEM